MPVKRRNAKRWVNAEREYQIWAVVFSAGFDFFGELGELDLPDTRPGHVPIELVREPWVRFGARHLSECGEGWAYRQLGHAD